jgi:hypothetical protein
VASRETIDLRSASRTKSTLSGRVTYWIGRIVFPCIAAALVLLLALIVTDHTPLHVSGWAEIPWLLAGLFAIWVAVAAGYATVNLYRLNPDYLEIGSDGITLRYAGPFAVELTWCLIAERGSLTRSGRLHTDPTGLELFRFSIAPRSGWDIWLFRTAKVASVALTRDALGSVKAAIESRGLVLVPTSDWHDPLDSGAAYRFAKPR